MNQEERDQIDWDGLIGRLGDDVELGVEELKSKIQEYENEISQLQDQLKRLQADSINYKRRMEEEREDLRQRANTNLVLKLLPVLDDYKRALDYIPQDENIGSWSIGVEMVYRSFVAALESMGVAKIEAIGSAFDPQEHESVSYEFTDKGEDDQVVSVVRDGYKLYGRVLRPAQVTLLKKRQDESA